MRRLAVAASVLLFVSLAGCGDDGPGSADLAASVDLASAADDLAVPRDLGARDLAPGDGGELPDQSPPCVPHTILDGTQTVTAQGWSIVGTASAITSDGLLVNFTTKGVPSGVGGASLQALATKSLPIATGSAYALEWRLKVLSTDGHNPGDSPVAFMASFTPAFGTTPERSQLIYFDAAAIGWADNTGSFAVDTSVFHVYRLDVSAAGHAELRVDGTLALTRDGFITNGTVAIGDQTNDLNYDADSAVYEVRLLCP